jgi:hypothetical protein
MQLSLLASTPDIAATGYMVNLLLGTPAAVAAEAKELGFDGVEFFPGPPGTIGVPEMDQALKSFDLTLTAVNSGQIVAEGLTLLHPDSAIRARALTRLKDLLDFAGNFGAPVTLAGTKGSLPSGASAEVAAALAEEIFSSLARFGAAAGSNRRGRQQLHLHGGRGSGLGPTHSPPGFGADAGYLSTPSEGGLSNRRAAGYGGPGATPPPVRSRPAPAWPSWAVRPRLARHYGHPARHRL